MPEEAPEQDGPGPDPASAPLQPTPGGRVFLGMVTALGLYLGLRQLVGGWVLATAADSDGWWLTADGLATVFGIQAAAVLFGAALAAAGRPAGIALGAAVGGLCGGLFLAAEVVGGAPAEQLVLLLQPVLLAVAGAVAGAIGAWVWTAVPVLDMPVPASIKKSSSIQLRADTPENTARPTAWVRVLAGAMVVVAGMTYAEKVRTKAEKATGGMLKVESRGQGKFLSWQFATLTVLAGGVWAGAGTGAGLRHGVFAGVLGAAGVVGLIAARGEVSQPAEYMLGQLNLVANDPTDPGALVGVGMGVVVTALVGGWFGGQLFLPLAPEHMRTPKLRMAGD